MSKELVIGSNRHETKVAVLEDDQLVEVYFQRGNEYSLAGSVHKGRVTRVLPGMQSAFVDLGLERDTFLYVTDFLDEQEDIDAVADEKPIRVDRREPFRGRAPELAVAVPARDEGQHRGPASEPVEPVAEVDAPEPEPSLSPEIAPVAASPATPNLRPSWNVAFCLGQCDAGSSPASGFKPAAFGRAS